MWLFNGRSQSVFIRCLIKIIIIRGTIHLPLRTFPDVFPVFFFSPIFFNFPHPFTDPKIDYTFYFNICTAKGITLKTGDYS